MKLTKEKLKQIIREEIGKAMNELGAGHGGTNPEFTAKVAAGEQGRAKQAKLTKCQKLKKDLQDVAETVNDMDRGRYGGDPFEDKPKYEAYAAQMRQELKDLGCEEMFKQEKARDWERLPLFTQAAEEKPEGAKWGWEKQ